MAGENQEIPITEEQKAAKGMEVKKSLRERMQEWIKQQKEKKGISSDVVRYWEKVKSLTTEGSLRRKVMDKLQPVVERGADVAEKYVKFSKAKLKIAGIVCDVAAFMSPEPVSKAILGAVGLSAGIASEGIEPMMRLGAKIGGAEIEGIKKVDKKVRFYEKIDKIVDRIFGWKPKEKPVVPPAEKVYFAEARPAVMPKR